MFLVDSHCHIDILNYKSLHRNVADVINKAHLRDVKLMLSVCTTLHGFQIMTSMMGDRDNVLFSCGIHPLNLEESCDFIELQQIAKESRVIAIGETGLDYYKQDNKIEQQKAFRKHIRLGIELNKPIIVHARSSFKDVLAILVEERAYECGCVLHCFTEDYITAKKVLDLGFYISFSGITTFRNAHMLRKSAIYVPLDRILLETDSPYLAPSPYRGQENQPAYLRDIAENIADLKGIPLTKLAEATTSNFGRLFHIDMELYL